MYLPDYLRSKHIFVSTNENCIMIFLKDYDFFIKLWNFVFTEKNK